MRFELATSTLATTRSSAGPDPAIAANCRNPAEFVRSRRFPRRCHSAGYGSLRQYAAASARTLCKFLCDGGTATVSPLAERNADNMQALVNYTNGLIDRPTIYAFACGGGYAAFIVGGGIETCRNLAGERSFSLSLGFGLGAVAGGEVRASNQSLRQANGLGLVGRADLPVGLGGSASVSDGCARQGTVASGGGGGLGAGWFVGISYTWAPPC